MLEAAIEAASIHGSAIVVAARQSQCLDLQYRCFQMCGGAHLRGRVLPSSGGEVIFRTCGDEDWRWDTMSFLGQSEYTKVFVDHYAIESKFGRVLHEWHRFDSEGERGRS